MDDGREFVQISAAYGDITRFFADAIVNAANCTLLGGGGVDGAIHRAAGPQLYLECQKFGGCRTGEAVVTPGFNLMAKYIIHTPGPVWNPERAEECDALLCSCYRNALLRAEEKGCNTIAFPSISTGVYRFPLERAAALVAKTLVEFFEDRETCLQAVTMVCFDEKTFKAYHDAISAALISRLEITVLEPEEFAAEDFAL